MANIHVFPTFIPGFSQVSKKLQGISKNYYLGATARHNFLPETTPRVYYWGRVFEWKLLFNRQKIIIKKPAHHNKTDDTLYQSEIEIQVHCNVSRFKFQNCLFELQMPYVYRFCGGTPISRFVCTPFKC